VPGESPIVNPPVEWPGCDARLAALEHQLMASCLEVDHLIVDGGGHKVVVFVRTAVDRDSGAF
jgi:hypothetical protein